MNPTDMSVILTGVPPVLVTSICKVLSLSSGSNVLHARTASRGALRSGNEICIGDTRLVSMLSIAPAFSSCRECATSYYTQSTSPGSRFAHTIVLVAPLA